jgi:hypothetical protein
VIENKKTSKLSDGDREIVMAEAREQSKLEPGVKKSTGGWPVKI